jgi:hypothetical protein
MSGSAAILLLPEGGVLRDKEGHKLDDLLKWESMVSLLWHK